MKFTQLFLHPILSIKKINNRIFDCYVSSPIISDKKAIMARFRKSLGVKLNLDCPETFNEKLNWMKLYYRKPIMTKMVDKYEAKELASNLIGSEHVIPSIGIYNSWEEIDFRSLKTPFVMKTTHSSGIIKIVKDLDDFNFNKVKRKFEKSLSKNYFYSSREWPYKNCEPRIIIEEYKKDKKEENLPVYKFFCFNGEPYIVQTIKNDKTPIETIDYFDMDWNRLDLRQNFPNSEVPLSKPSKFEEMKSIAAKLSKGFPFVRVDLYSINGEIFFSEFTFFSDAGYSKFYPEEWDLELGEKIKLNLDEKYC